MKEPLSNDDAREWILEILERGEVAFSKHALDEMQKDGISRRQVRNVLWAGQVINSEQRQDTWRYKVQAGRVTVMVSFASDERLVVVTAWRKR